MATTLEINANTGEEWDIVFPLRKISGDDYIVQKVKQLLQMQTGDSFTNEDYGIPYIALMQKKGQNIELWKTTIKNTLENNEVLQSLGVQSVSYKEVSFDGVTRSLKMVLLISKEDGSAIEEDFVL